MNTTTRTRGVTVRVLDVTPLCDQAAAKLGGDVTATRLGFRIALATDTNGNHYVVCDEGVGWAVNADTPLELEFYDETIRLNEEGVELMSIVPAVLGKVSLDTLEGLFFEEADLADFVRSFGERLETNFRTWHHILTEGA